MVTRFRGDTNSMVWTLKLNGVAADLTTVSSSAFTYNKRDGTVVTLVGTVTDAVNGEITFAVTSTDFDEAGEFLFDIQVVYNDTTIRTFIKDDLIIEDDVKKI